MRSPKDNGTLEEKPLLYLLGFFKLSDQPRFCILGFLSGVHWYFLLILYYVPSFSIKPSICELPKQISSNNSRQFAMKDEYNKNSAPRPGMVHNFALRMPALLKYCQPPASFCFPRWPHDTAWGLASLISSFVLFITEEDGGRKSGAQCSAF